MFLRNEGSVILRLMISNLLESWPQRNQNKFYLNNSLANNYLQNTISTH